MKQWFSGEIGIGAPYRCVVKFDVEADYRRTLRAMILPYCRRLVDCNLNRAFRKMTGEPFNLCVGIGFTRPAPFRGYVNLLIEGTESNPTLAALVAAHALRTVDGQVAARLHAALDWADAWYRHPAYTVSQTMEEVDARLVERYGEVRAGVVLEAINAERFEFASMLRDVPDLQPSDPDHDPYQDESAPLSLCRTEPC